MSLRNCKECNHKVSTSASSCPNCGAKQPPRTSRVTWLVLLLIGSIFLASFFTDETPLTKIDRSNIVKAEKTKESEKSETVKLQKPRWRTFDSVNEMTGERSFYATSPPTYSTKPMSFPYTGVEASLTVGCSRDSYWAYVFFTTAPSLTNDETKDGYNLISSRVKWDDDLSTLYLTQEWGSKFLQFRNDEAVVEKIKISEEALLELHWHSQENVYFRFNLNGSTKAINEIFSKCNL